LQRVNFNYYHQKEKKYYKNSIEEPVEIVSCANLDASLAKVASDGSGLVDPYVKVKFAKPFKNTHHHHRKNTSTASAASVVVAALPSSPSKGSMRNLVGITTTEEVGTDIHKTKAVKQT